MIFGWFIISFHNYSSDIFQGLSRYYIPLPREREKARKWFPFHNFSFSLNWCNFKCSRRVSSTIWFHYKRDHIGRFLPEHYRINGLPPERYRHFSPNGFYPHRYCPDRLPCKRYCRGRLLPKCYRRGRSIPERYRTDPLRSKNQCTQRIPSKYYRKGACFVIELSHNNY